MEIGAEHDPVIGQQAPDPEDLSEDWIKLARRNVNEVPELREERIARCSVSDFKLCILYNSESDLHFFGILWALP